VIAAIDAMSRLSGTATVSALDRLASLSLTETVSSRSRQQAYFSYAFGEAAVAALASRCEKPLVAFSVWSTAAEIIHGALWQIRLGTDCVERHCLKIALEIL